MSGFCESHLVVDLEVSGSIRTALAVDSEDLVLHQVIVGWFLS